MSLLLQWDHQLFHLINTTLTHPLLDAFFPFVTDLHKTLWFKISVPLFLILALWQLYRSKSVGLVIGCILCFSAADGFSTNFIKDTVRRPRPFVEMPTGVTQRSPAGSFSFPSNHSVNSFAACTFLSAFVPFYAPVLYGIAAITAYSRVYNGVHFPSDVFVGALIGILFGILFARLARMILRIPKPGRLP